MSDASDAAPPVPAALAAPTVTIRFLRGWRIEQDGVIRRGGRLVVDYDPERLPACRVNWQGAEAWDIDVELRFHPGGQFVRASVLDEVRSPPGYGMVVGHVRRLVPIEVPADAERVEMWFHNYDKADGRCHAWDSRFGQNYAFDVIP